MTDRAGAFHPPGERVNRPTFGSGLMQLVFAPNSDELATATQFLVQGALQQWLGDLIQVDEVQVESEDSTLRVADSVHGSAHAAIDKWREFTREDVRDGDTILLCDERRRAAIRRPDGAGRSRHRSPSLNVY